MWTSWDNPDYSLFISEVGNCQLRVKIKEWSEELSKISSFQWFKQHEKQNCQQKNLIELLETNLHMCFRVSESKTKEAMGVHELDQSAWWSKNLSAIIHFKRIWIQSMSERILCAFMTLFGYEKGAKSHCLMIMWMEGWLYLIRTRQWNIISIEMTL